MMIDSHAHLALFPPDEVDGIVNRAKEALIASIINISTRYDELSFGLELAKRYPWIYNVAAIPPHDVEKENGHFEQIAERAKEGKLVAIGECGLDYYWGEKTKEKQKKLFRQTIDLAHELNLPLVIHCRDAFSDLFQIADDEKMGSQILIHCFTGDKKEAQEIISRGWSLSFSGIITFKKSEHLREIAKEIPIEKLMIETDAPYLAPEPNRGKRNEPAYLRFTAECIASLRACSVEEFCHQASQNTLCFFHLKK